MPAVSRIDLEQNALELNFQGYYVKPFHLSFDLETWVNHAGINYIILICLFWQMFFVNFLKKNESWLLNHSYKLLKPPQNV